MKGGKDAAAADSMQKGGWDREEFTYRDLIRDKDQAVSLGTTGKSLPERRETIDFLLAELSEI